MLLFDIYMLGKSHHHERIPKENSKEALQKFEAMFSLKACAMITSLHFFPIALQYAFGLLYLFPRQYNVTT